MVHSLTPASPCVILVLVPHPTPARRFAEGLGRRAGGSEPRSLVNTQDEMFVLRAAALSYYREKCPDGLLLSLGPVGNDIDWLRNYKENIDTLLERQ